VIILFPIVRSDSWRSSPRGGGDWDARWIDLTIDARFGPGERTVLEELEALQRLGLVARDDSRSGVGGRWTVTAGARRYIQ
jgi:hypothetical protein